MAEPLSPAAQAVLDAAFSAYWSAEQEAPNDEQMIAAAAVKAAADQVVPEETWLGTEEPCYAYYRQRCNTRRDLLAIAAELEGTK
jgi:hypothetical protein